MDAKKEVGDSGYLHTYFIYINMFVTMLAPGINTKNAIPSFDIFLTCR
jgi:hypothetical protein